MPRFPFLWPRRNPTRNFQSIKRLIRMIDHLWLPDLFGTVGPWQWTRTVNYIVPLKQFGGIGPSHAYTEETYTLIMASSSRWEASIIARTPCVPMGNCFQISLSMSSEDKPHGGCMMRVIGAVDFFKPMRLREFVIRRPALSGMRMTYAALMDLISQQALEYVPSSVYGLPTIRTPVSSQVRRYPYSHELMSFI